MTRKSQGNSGKQVELQRELIMNAVRIKGRPLTRAEMQEVKADAALMRSPTKRTKPKAPKGP
jgi:hypothetical protein